MRLVGIRYRQMIQDAFRTIDWRKIREELEELKLVLGIQLVPVKI